MHNKREWRGKSGGGKFGQKALIFFFRFFGIWFAYFWLAFVVPFYMLFARKAYLAIYRYFRVRCGYAPLRAFWASYKNHYIFGQTFLDKFTLYAKRNKKYFKYTIEGFDLYQEALKKDNGILFCGSHIGNYEILGYLVDIAERRVTSLIFGGEAAVMQQNRDEVLGQNNINLVPVSDDMSHLFAVNNAARDGEIVSIFCDRSFGGGRSQEVDFMGAKADFPTGTFHIAKRYSLTSFSIHVVKVGMKSYKVIIEPVVGSSVEELLLSYVASVEKVLKQYPTQWFNFYEFWKN